MTGETIQTSPMTESFSDLWDGYDIVTKASDKGVLLLKDILKFFKKRAAHEDEYSKSLSKLVTKFESLAPDGYIGSKVKNTWDQIKLESLSHSSYHENICTNIQTQICEPIEGLILDLETKHKVIHSEAEKAFLVYQESVGKLRKSKQNYEKLVKESMEVTGVSKGETQKVQKRAIKAAQDVIKADREYRAQIIETNNQQKVLLNDQLPKIMTDMQRLEMIRIHFIKNYFLKYFKSIETTSRLDGDSSILAVIQLINTEDEIQEFIKKAKLSQNPHNKPKPFEYEPYTSTPSSSSPFPISVSPSGSFNSGSVSPGISLSGSSGSINPLSGSGGFPEPSPTKDKRPSGWSLKRLSSTISFDKKSIMSSTNMRTPNFACKVEDIMMAQKAKYPSLEVPAVLVILKRKMVQLDYCRTQGIFRVPGNVVDINAYKKRMDEGNFEMTASENVYTVASLLKAWLRDLPEPLFPVSMYDQCIMICERPEAILTIIQCLPVLSQRILSYIIQMLQDAIIPSHVELSKMGSDNLAMVFAPCFLRSPYTDANILLGNIIKEKEFVKNIIDHYKPLSVNDDLVDSIQFHQQQLQKTLNKSIESPALLHTKSKSMMNVSVSASPSKPIPVTGGSQSAKSSPVSSPVSSPKTICVEQSPPTPLSPPPIMGGAYGGQQVLQNPKVSLLKHSEPSIQVSPPQQPSSPSTAGGAQPNTPKNSVHLTPPSTPTFLGNKLTGLGAGVMNPFDLLSPSEIKRRSNLKYQDEQERVKELIDDAHTYVNELYSDITTNDTTCYYAMQSSLSICKFTKSLETYITQDMQISLDNVRDSIKVNKFVSPPAIQFKIPSSLPKLVPLSSNEELLRNWLNILTLSVNRFNEYLCYFGGVVLRIYSPENMETISSLFESLETLKPVDKPQYRALTVEQADTLISKILPLIQPLIPFSDSEAEINTSISESVTPTFTSSPPNPNIIRIDLNQSLVETPSPTPTNTSVVSPISTSSNPPTSTEISMEEEQFKFDEHSQESPDQIIRAKVLNITRIFTEKYNLLNQLDFSLKESQDNIKTIAKTTLSLKRELESYLLENNIEIEVEQLPVVDSDTPSAIKLKIMTQFFITRINYMLSILFNHPYNSILSDILSNYEL